MPEDDHFLWNRLHICASFIGL